MAPLSAARRAATPLLLSAAARAATASSTPVAAATTPTQLFSAAAATTSRAAAATSMDRIVRSAAARTLVRRAVSCPASIPNAAIRTCGFSSVVLGNRPIHSAPTHLAAGGSLIASRAIASQSEAFSPELKKELQRMEKASMARHEELAKRFRDFEASVKKGHALFQVDKANSVLQNARVVWRVVWGSLAAAAVGIWYLLLTKSLWGRDFKISALQLLTELMVKLQLDLEKELKKIVREEVEKQEK